MLLLVTLRTRVKNDMKKKPYFSPNLTLLYFGYPSIVEWEKKTKLSIKGNIKSSVEKS